MKKLQKTNRSNYLLLVLFLAIASCSKEPLSIKDVPLAEVESSWYELSDNTLEIQANEYDDIVLSRSESSISLRNNEMTSALKVGDNLVASWDVPREKILLDEIVEINTDGSTINITTVPTTMIKAYKNFYIDSEKSNVIGLRTEIFNLNDNSEKISLLASSLISSYARIRVPQLEPEIKMNLSITGILNFKNAHPNTMYEDKCQCNAIPNDSNNNGVYDVVETAFNISEDDIDDEGYYKTGFYTIGIEDFGFAEFGLGASITKPKVKIGEFYQNGDPGDKLLSAKDLYKKIRETKEEPKSIQEALLDFTHIPTPLTVGPAGVYVTIGPLFDPVLKGAAFASFVAINDKKFDIVLGHVNLMEDKQVISVSDLANVIDLNFIFKNKDGSRASVSDLFSGIETKFTVGVKGELSCKVGINFGVSLGVGAPKTAGAASGMIMPFGIKPFIKGSMVASTNDLSSFVTFDFENIDISGSDICTGIEMGIFDYIAFTDTNFPIPFTTGKEFDYAIKLPKTGLLPDLVWNVLEPFTGNPDGLCLCEAGALTALLDVEKFEYSISGNVAGFDYKVDNVGLEHDLYIYNGTDTLLIENNIPLAKDTSNLITVSPEWVEYLNNKDFQILVNVGGECEKVYDATQASFAQFGCLEYETEVSNPSETLAKNSPNYSNALLMTNSTAKDQFSLLSPVDTEIYIRDKIENEGSCLNSTGLYFYDLGNGGWKFGNAGSTYIWTTDLEGIDEEGKTRIFNALEIIHETGGSYTYRKRALVDSKYAAVLKF
jgi:hypothetical protein